MVHRYIRYVLLAVMVFGITACGGAPEPLRGSSTLTVVESQELPRPTRVDQMAQNRPYLVGPFDKLIIDVFGIEEMKEREVQVDAAGFVSFPLVGSFQVAGRTPSEIETELENRLADNFIRDPQVTVNLEETVSQVITIDGQVARPGLYPVVGRMSLIQTVATAGGTTEFAKLEDVVVFRQSEGQRFAALYNLKAVRRGYYDDPEMFAGDIVVVGDSNARRLFRDVLAAAPLLTAPIIAYLNNSP